MGKYDKIIRETAREMKLDEEEYRQALMDKREEIRRDFKIRLNQKITFKPVGRSIIDLDNEIRDFFNEIARR